MARGTPKGPCESGVLASQLQELSHVTVSLLALCECVVLCLAVCLITSHSTPVAALTHLGAVCAGGGVAGSGGADVD